MSHEVWIARDGDGAICQFYDRPKFESKGKLHVTSGRYHPLPRDAFPFIKPGECVRFVAAERYVNGEPVSDGETIPVRIAVVANEKREWNSFGYLDDNGQQSDSTLFSYAEECFDGDCVSRTIITARVPVPRVTEVQGVVEGTVQ